MPKEEYRGSIGERSRKKIIRGCIETKLYVYVYGPLLLTKAFFYRAWVPETATDPQVSDRVTVVSLIILYISYIKSFIFKRSNLSIENVRLYFFL